MNICKDSDFAVPIDFSIEIDEKTSNVSLVATKIMSSQVVPKSLFCPFCADEYMFEFSLKDHLKRKHGKEIAKMKNDQKSNDLPESEQIQNEFTCPYCEAVFYSKLVMPKHIFHHHGRNWVQHYRQNYCTDMPATDKENEPTVMYAACSPGLSDIFEKLMTKDFHSLNNLCDSDSPKLKSILKKTPNKSYNPILGSPSSASIRKYRSNLVKRSLSARRELRFDLPPLQNSPPQVVRKHKKFWDLLRLFKFRRFGQRTTKNSPIKKSKTKSDKYMNLNIATMITSTPLNFLDDDPLDDFTQAVDSYEVKESPNGKGFNGKFKNSWKVKNKPLLFLVEKFQCGVCDEKYISNTDLLMHLKDKHKSKYILNRLYKCGYCGKKFFKNQNLIRHTYVHNTPEKS